MLNKTNEWFVEAIWGRIACVSWGDPKNPPVLLVHGYMDSAATFIPIIKHLPDTYYYVAVDLPGHGRSDPFPVGPLISQAHQVYAIHIVIEHLKWESFAYMTHSIGFIIGAIFNYIYPFRIKKMINLDPAPPISTYCSHEYSPHVWYLYIYDDYYENYSRWEYERTKLFTYNQAINLLVKSRNLTKEQSAVILSRILVPMGDGMYRLSWEPSMKKISSIPITEDMFVDIVTKNAPPMLNIVSSEDETIDFFKQKGVRIMKRLQESISNFIVITVNGPHDVHITNPESFVDSVVDFLTSDVKNVPPAKL